jgi:hypothetical protein
VRWSNVRYQAEIAPAPGQSHGITTYSQTEELAPSGLPEGTDLNQIG